MNYHALFRKLEVQLSEIEHQQSLTQTIGLLIQRILSDFSEDFGFIGSRLYILDEDDDAYRLESKFGSSGTAPIGFEIPVTYRPIKVVCRKGIVYMGPAYSWIDL